VDSITSKEDVATLIKEATDVLSDAIYSPLTAMNIGDFVRI
jgi:hypothetical protein